jgi:hypothetical protein
VAIEQPVKLLTEVKTMTACYLAAIRAIKELQVLMAAATGDELTELIRQLEELLDNSRF